MFRISQIHDLTGSVIKEILTLENANSQTISEDNSRRVESALLKLIEMWDSKERENYTTSFLSLAAMIKQRRGLTTNIYFEVYVPLLYHLETIRRRYNEKTFNSPDLFEHLSGVYTFTGFMGDYEKVINEEFRKPDTKIQ